MNPFQKNKVDVSALTPEEQKAFRLYGKLPNRKDVIQNKLKERKYFDSGDYALSKAGKTSEISPTDVGREHPVPENIPHLSSSPSNSSGAPGSGSNGAGSLPTLNQPGSVGAGGVQHGHAGAGLRGGPTFAPPQGASLAQGGSPVKESSWLQRETTLDDLEGEDARGAAEGSISPPAKREGVPIRGAR